MNDKILAERLCVTRINELNHDDQHFIQKWPFVTNVNCQFCRENEFQKQRVLYTFGFSFFAGLTNKWNR